MKQIALFLQVIFLSVGAAYGDVRIVEEHSREVGITLNGLAKRPFSMPAMRLAAVRAPAYAPLQSRQLPLPDDPGYSFVSAPRKAAMAGALYGGGAAFVVGFAGKLFMDYSLRKGTTWRHGYQEKLSAVSEAFGIGLRFAAAGALAGVALGIIFGFISARAKKVC